jgi:hypothetical protein
MIGWILFAVIVLWGSRIAHALYIVRKNEKSDA